MKKLVVVCQCVEVIALAVWVGGLVSIIAAVIPAVFGTIGMEAGRRILTRTFQGYDRLTQFSAGLLLLAMVVRTWGAGVWSPSANWKEQAGMTELVLLMTMVAIAAALTFWLTPETARLQGIAFSATEDVKSSHPWLAGFIVKEACPDPSNWRSRLSLDEYLRQHGIVGIQGIDTRALTTHLRDHGSQQGVISHADLDSKRVVQKARAAPGILGRDLVKEVTCAKPYKWTERSGRWNVGAGGALPDRAPSHFRVVAYDFGIKYNILRRLVDEGFEVTVVPASTTADAPLALNPDGLFLSHAPR